jgi:hypothetical protein
LTPDNSVLLLIDHQVGLMQIIDDMPPEQAKNNVLGLARTAKSLGIPVLLTTSRDWGPNGPVLPELADLFPDAKVIRRPRVINAYRWPAFGKRSRASAQEGNHRCGDGLSTCLQFPALDMIQDGYEVHGVIDGSSAEAPGQIVRDACVATLALGVVTRRTAGLWPPA